MARVRNITREDLPAPQRPIYDGIAEPRGRKTIGNGFEALMNSPEVAGRVGALGAYLRFQSEIPGATRELVIMVVAHEMGCDYEWTHHREIARKIGVSDSSIKAIHDGTAPDGLNPEEATVTRYALELMRQHHVSDDLFNPALKQLGAKNLVDLTVMVGYYSLLAMTFLALHVEVEPGTTTLHAR